MNDQKHVYKKNKAGILKKNLSMLIALFLLFSLLPISISAEEEVYIERELTFNQPTIEIYDPEENLISITIEGIQQGSGERGKPSLPQHIELISLPLTAQNINVEFIPGTTHQMHLPDGSQPLLSPFSLPLLPPNSPIKSQEIPIYTDQDVTQDIAFGDHFSFSIQTGITNSERNIIVATRIMPCVFSSMSRGILEYFTHGILTITYTMGTSSLSSTGDQVDLLILSPSGYLNQLQSLVTHKEAMGLNTKLVSLDEIYEGVYFDTSEVFNRDSQEKIKYFIHQAINEWDVTYVLAVGGWRSFFGLNNPKYQFPIRYSHLDDTAEPGYACDQYYSCCQKFEGDQVIFDSWDSNGDDVFAEFHGHPVEWWHADPSKPKDTYDVTPDVYFGRLASRNPRELKTLINKIITYETTTFNQEWFQKMLTITGDGFQDINIEGQYVYKSANKVTWSLSSVENGDYTIYAQSQLYFDSSVKGPIDEVHITIDDSAQSRVTFKEEDHLKMQPLDPEKSPDDYPDVCPALPVAEIVIPSDGDILGNTNVNYIPPEAYIGEYWAEVEYTAGTSIGIRFKSYDPTPKSDIIPPTDFASKTRINVWVNNSAGETVLGPYLKTPKPLYYEGEMECQKGIFWMNDFEAEKLWASNGKWVTMNDVIEGISDGYGFVYFAGHGNPMSWGDHLPGIPGGRDDGMINGLKNINLDFGLSRYESETGDPFFPMDRLTNGDKQAVTLIGGCHNSMIDVSFMKLLVDPEEVLFTVLHGAWVPECFSYWLTRMPQGGAIASIGCAGLGYGSLGASCLNSAGGWINPRFFYVYNQEQRDILGEVFTETLQDYAIQFGVVSHYDTVDRKTFEEWMLLGDPSLKIGGYPLTTSLDDEDDIIIGDIEINEEGMIHTTITNTGVDNFTYFDWMIRFDETAPLARYFGLAGTILERLFRGHIVKGELTTAFVANLKPGNLLDISSSSKAVGFGHVEVNVSILQNEDLITSKVEDGFLLGSRIMLYHPEE